MIPFSRRSSFSILLIIPILLSILGCDEFGLLENLDSDPAVRIALDDGGLSPGDYLDLWVDFQNNPPDRVTARLEKDGEPYLDLEIATPPDGWERQTGTSGVLHIPAAVPEGRYVLVTEAWSGDELLVEQSTDSYVILGDWKIEGLDSFPPQGVPGGIFFVRAVLDMPDNSDPWIKWVWENVTIAEGLYSAGWDEVVFEAGDRTGMGSLIVELHPGIPDSEDSPVQSIQTELYTVPALRSKSDALEKSESYSIYMQFDGTLGDEPRPDIIGKPIPVVLGSDTGFRLSDGAGLSWEGLPSGVINLGTTEPFSLNIGFLPDSGDVGRILSMDDSESFSLVVSRVSRESLSLVVNDEPAYSSTFFLPESYQSPMDLTISFLPADSGLALVWKIDGDTFHIDHWHSIPVLNGETINIDLGSEGGFGGVLTSFSIHVRDADGIPAAEGDRYSIYQDREEPLLIAEGFEDEKIEAEIKFDDRVFVDGGSLVIPPDSAVKFPEGGGVRLAIGTISGKDSAILRALDPVSGDIYESILVNDEFYSNSPYRISILLEKLKLMSDNETEVVYELKASSQNESNLRLEHILVVRE